MTLFEIFPPSLILRQTKKGVMWTLRIQSFYPLFKPKTKLDGEFNTNIRRLNLMYLRLPCPALNDGGFRVTPIVFKKYFFGCIRLLQVWKEEKQKKYINTHIKGNRMVTDTTKAVLTGHHVMFFPARKYPPTVPLLARTEDWNRKIRLSTFFLV